MNDADQENWDKVNDTKRHEKWIERGWMTLVSFKRFEMVIDADYEICESEWHYLRYETVNGIDWMNDAKQETWDGVNDTDQEIGRITVIVRYEA